MLKEIAEMLGVTGSKIALTFFTAIFFVLLRSILIRIVTKKAIDLRTRFAWKQTLSYLILFLAIGVVAIIWSKRFEAIFTLLTLISAALIISTKELILNLAANMVIILRNLFQVGDRIKINTYYGDVVDSGPMYFTLAEVNTEHTDAHSGAVIKIPNSLILTTPLVNFTKGCPVVWTEFTHTMNLKGNWQETRDKLNAIVSKYAHLFDSANHLGDYGEILFEDKNKKSFITIDDNTIKITVRAAFDLKKNKEIESKVWEEFAEWKSLQIAKNKANIEEKGD